MAEHQARISELAELMTEYGLSEAHLKVGELEVSFRRKPTQAPQNPATEAVQESADDLFDALDAQANALEAAPNGIPVSSPMTGIFYGAPSPSSPPFVKEGDTVTAGQIVGLIEAMKVFNEIPCPVSGTVLKLVAASGQLVQPGDPLLLVG